jgi:hypothetical protein
MTVAFPPKVRAVIYWAYVVICVLLGSAATWFGAIEAPQPDWLKAANAVALYFGAAFGLTAASNVVIKTTPAVTPANVAQVEGPHWADRAENQDVPPEEPEDYDPDDDTIPGRIFPSEIQARAEREDWNDGR